MSQPANRSGGRLSVSRSHSEQMKCIVSSFLSEIDPAGQAQNENGSRQAGKDNDGNGRARLPNQAPHSFSVPRRL